ncbi:MAG: YceD family protein [bacterium]
MTVDLRPLRDERGATLIVACHETVPSQIAEVPFAEPVEGRLVLTNLGSVLRVEGHLVTHVEMACDRCARPFRYRLEARVLEDLEWTGVEGPLATEGATATLDLQALAREQLLLALPMVARCDEACEGLCDRCGAVRGACNCRVEEVDPRLAPLERWRRDPQ